MTRKHFKQLVVAEHRDGHPGPGEKQGFCVLHSIAACIDLILGAVKQTVDKNPGKCSMEGMVAGISQTMMLRAKLGKNVNEFGGDIQPNVTGVGHA